MAGIYSGGRGSDPDNTSENLKVSARSTPEWILESYHYIGKREALLSMMRKRNDTIFLDSGAYSAFTQKTKIDINAYAQFIHKNRDVIHLASNLDAIGKPEQETYDNQKTLESLGCKVLPTFHAREDPKWLVKYLDEGYDHIALGGMVPESTGWLLRWLDDLWSKYLTNPDGTASVQVHGFGLTAKEPMLRYPWHSVDSTSWVMTSRFGGCFLDMLQLDGTIKDFKVDFSTKSTKVSKLDAHFDTLAPAMQEQITEYVEDLGYKVDHLREMYGWRDHFNIAYFNRMQKRGTKTFKLKARTLY